MEVSRHPTSCGIKNLYPLLLNAIQDDLASLVKKWEARVGAKETEKRTGETKWWPREDARPKAGRQRRTRELYDIGTVRSHRSTGLRLEHAPVPKRRFGRAVRGIGGRNSGREPGLEVTQEKPSGNTGKTSDTSPDSSTSAEEKQGKPEARGPRDSKRTQGGVRGGLEKYGPGPGESRGRLPRQGKGNTEEWAMKI
ncbi:hypothetical protein NDU88_007707 [Pleurodeles waltl]|uniref:Uncharacterized protein n=1 Tax=Pleurodeles waltl TaxID=8319 RepID=A0AAV7QLP1_PLEWA|nr:hypothetical protein NDU88_007707 [Pleurodeles waltl]